MIVFFVVGAQKSGSTWLQQLIDSHPLFTCKGEGHFFDRVLYPCTKIFNDYNKLMKTVERTVYEGDGHYTPVSWAEFRDMARIWITRRIEGAQSSDSVAAIGDKTPAYSLHLPLIKEVFPEAKFIHLARDGRDVTVSAYFHMQRVMAQDGTINSLDTFDKLAAPLLLKWYHYCQPCMDYSERDSPSDMLTVRYEDLKASPQHVLQSVFSFLLGDAASVTNESVERCIAENQFSHKAGRNEGIESSSSFLRKGIVGDWKNHFTDGILTDCDPKVMHLLHRLGYS